MATRQGRIMILTRRWLRTGLGLYSGGGGAWAWARLTRAACGDGARASGAGAPWAVGHRFVWVWGAPGAPAGSGARGVRGWRAGAARRRAVGLCLVLVGMLFAVCRTP